VREDPKSFIASKVTHNSFEYLDPLPLSEGIVGASDLLKMRSDELGQVDYLAFDPPPPLLTDVAVTSRRSWCTFELLDQTASVPPPPLK